jgi:hypothetical protein
MNGKGWGYNSRYRSPDFIIAEAMKAGTAALHHILDHNKMTAILR